MSQICIFLGKVFTEINGTQTSPGQAQGFSLAFGEVTVFGGGDGGS